MNIAVDIHALQTLPPSLVNRDDLGAPKTAIFGGVPRQRVSSQSWKRAIRRAFENHDVSSVGLRSKYLPSIIVQKALELNPDLDQEVATKRVKEVFKAAGWKKLDDLETKPESSEHQMTLATSALLFLSAQQIELVAELVADMVDDIPDSEEKKEVKRLFDSEHSVDIAMFGRMVADVPAYNVDASVQVSHAISVHETQPEFDYYTAVDDIKEDSEESGAAMIGTVQMISSTLYRFATVNVDGLAHNLGQDEAAYKATALFVKAFIESMPTGKQNTFANNTLPEFVLVNIRDDRSISLVNAFEDPVTATKDLTRRQAAVKRLSDEERDIRKVYGYEPRYSFVISTSGLAKYFEEDAELVTLSELNDLIKAKLEEVNS